MDTSSRLIKITDICEIEHAKKQTYPQGTIYMYLSGVSNTIHLFYILDHPTVLGDRSTAILKPTVQVNPFYLYCSLLEAEDAFRQRYQTTINFQFENLKHLEIKYHDDLDVQNHIARIIRQIELNQKREEEMIRGLKEVKKFMLDGMFPHQ